MLALRLVFGLLLVAGIVAFAFYVATFIPSALYPVLYAATGEEACIRRARILWKIAKVFAPLTFNIAIWGLVAVALWRTWF
jgi:hypothetical protein